MKQTFHLLSRSLVVDLEATVGDPKGHQYYLARNFFQRKLLLFWQSMKDELPL